MTRKMMLIAGAAGLALTVPALAEKGGDRGKQAEAQRGGGGEKAQRAERPQRAERQEIQRAERPQRMERQMQRAERPQRMERQMQRAERPQRMERQIQRAERPKRVERQVERQERQRFERPQRIEREAKRQDRPQRVEREARRQEQAQRLERQQQRFERRAERPEREQRIERNQRRVERQAERQQQRLQRNDKLDRGQQRIERREQVREARRDMRQEDRQQRRFERRSAERLFAPRLTDRERDNRDIRTARFDGRGYRPLAPVFATRDMREMKPFKAKFDDRRFVSIGERYDNSYNWSPVPAIYGSRYVDNDDYYYRYDDDFGYAYQINRRNNLVSSFYPLFGGYGIGDPWPQTYYSSYVPLGYRDYYYDTPDYYYRNDGYGIYQVDAGSQLITALVSLVLGQSYGVGQVLPVTYGTYNVPLSYRANYYDTDDSYYRYGDGFIYQVDPVSYRVEQRYPLYSDNYYVGERWPVAYPDYNVPYGYRSAYADSPQYHYRYANGGIYQVDPTNQLILALAALVTGDQFAVGQPMPSGYDIYNVPVDYRDRWADSDDEYYRYANGYVYQIDADTGLIEEQYSVYA